MAGNRWYEITEAIGPRPPDPTSGSRIMVEADRIGQLEPPAVLLPYKKMGQSASGIACDTTGGKFGPFQGQLFVGDQTFSTVMRVALEKVKGHYQGACFPFRSGLASDEHRVRSGFGLADGGAETTDRRGVSADTLDESVHTTALGAKHEK